MPLSDIREFIAKLEKEGEAQRVDDEVGWNLEAGAMVRWSNERGLPAPFFQKIKDYPKGYTIFGAPLASYKRLAIAMDMDKNTHPKQLIEELIRRKQKPIKPILVKEGPCKENIYLGDEVDLLRFPVPLVHEGDGGRYIGTWHIDIAKDFGSDWVNWGMHRHMVHNSNTIGIMATKRTHIMEIFTRGYEARNKSMDVAIAIGVEPISTVCAATALPYGVSEVDIAGGIRGKPLELIKCETVDLAVPATAEIVIEGEIVPHETMDEGPFGEYTGYVVGRRQPWPVIRVKAITHRNNPILTMTCMGTPVDDDAILVSITKGAEFAEAFRTRGISVTGVSIFPETAGMLVVVAVKDAYPAVADEIAHVIWSLKGGSTTPYVIVVDDDIDPFNLSQVFHALVTKCHPYRGIVKLERTIGWPLAPWASRYELEYRLGAKAYFDCTWPRDWEPADIPRKCSFETIYPLEIQQKALAKWRKYGW